MAMEGQPQPTPPSAPPSSPPAKDWRKATHALKDYCTTLEARANKCVRTHKTHLATIARLETAVAALATKYAAERMESRWTESNSELARWTDKMEVRETATAAMLAEWPDFRADSLARFTEIDETFTSDSAEQHRAIDARLSALEEALKPLGNAEELKRVQKYVDAAVTVQAFDEISTSVQTSRDGLSSRIDTYAGKTLVELQEGGEKKCEKAKEVQERVQEELWARHFAIEELHQQEAEIAARCEREVLAKATPDDAARTCRALEEQLSAMRGAMEAQMEWVLDLATRSAEGSAGLLQQLEGGAATKAGDYEPLAEAASKLEDEIEDLMGRLEEKIDAASADAAFAEVAAMQKEDHVALRSKASEANVLKRHEYHSHLFETKLKGLREDMDTNGGEFVALADSVENLKEAADSKAGKADVHALMQVNEDIQNQIMAVKDEYRGLVKLIDAQVKKHGGSGRRSGAS